MLLIVIVLLASGSVSDQIAELQGNIHQLRTEMIDEIKAAVGEIGENKQTIAFSVFEDTIESLQTQLRRIEDQLARFDSIQEELKALKDIQYDYQAKMESLTTNLMQNVIDAIDKKAASVSVGAKFKGFMKKIQSHPAFVSVIDWWKNDALIWLYSLKGKSFTMLKSGWNASMVFCHQSKVKAMPLWRHLNDVIDSYLSIVVKKNPVFKPLKSEHVIIAMACFTSIIILGCLCSCCRCCRTKKKVSKKSSWNPVVVRCVIPFFEDTTFSVTIDSPDYDRLMNRLAKEAKVDPKCIEDLKCDGKSIPKFALSRLRSTDVIVVEINNKEYLQSKKKI